MYCPECGTDAAGAKFCPECGNDLTSLNREGVCAECGAEAGRAKFCPECGSQMPKRASGQRCATGITRSQRPRAQRRAAERQGKAPLQKSKTPVSLIWGGIAVVAAVVVIIVAMTAGGGGSTRSGSETVTADTSGSYSELVDRANGLYDQGIEKFNKKDSTAGEQDFRNAAAVYKAAWEKQPGDPNVGTDMSVALFYSRHHDEALQAIATVLKKTPDFQPAHLNKGIFLKTEWQESQDKGESARAARFLARAKLAFEKAVAIDAKSEGGQRAAELLKSI